MSWAEFSTQFDKLLQSAALGLTEAPGFFSIRPLPRTLADKTYCLWCDGLKGSTANSQGRLPIASVKVSVMYELGDNRPELREAAFKNVEDIIRVITNPTVPQNTGKTSEGLPGMRIVQFIGARSRLYTESGTWVIFDVIFEVEYTLSYL